VDLNITFKSDMFSSIKSLASSSHDLLIMKWILDLNTRIKHLTFDCNGQHIFGKTCRPINMGCKFCDKRYAHLGCGNYKKSGEKSNWIFYFVLTIMLPLTWSMEALGVIFPWYWMIVECEESFKKPLNVIQTQYWYPKRIGLDQTLVLEVLFFVEVSLKAQNTI